MRFYFNVYFFFLFRSNDNNKLDLIFKSHIIFVVGSPWRDKISLAILELQEKGVIQILYDKWWKNTGEVCHRDDKSKESKASALGVENIGRLRKYCQFIRKMQTLKNSFFLHSLVLFKEE